MDKICFECDNEIDGHKFHFYGTYGGGASGGYATDGSKKPGRGTMNMVPTML